MRFKWFNHLLAVICSCHIVGAQVTFHVNFGDPYRSQQGIGWPHTLHVAEGHEALLKLSRTLDNQESCVVITPGGDTFDVNQPPNVRYESWSDDCGVRVKHVTHADEGRWKLIATRGNTSYSGWTEVYVEESVDRYQASPITLNDGQINTQVDLSTLSNSYCVVAQPFTESSLVPGHCRVTLDRTTRAVQGNWNVLLGIPGRVSELQIERRVAVEAERLDPGFVRDTSANKLNLYCNILHTSKNITFCRFQKTSASIGYNIIDGLSDGRHSYYGDGFASKHCGMTIESPTADDYGTWRCTLGVQEWVGTAITQQTPMQALVRVTESTMLQRVLEEETIEQTIIVQKGLSFTITCRSDVSLSYCWFQHPNRTQYTPVHKMDDNQEFWYTGESLQLGDCGITFQHATDEDEGEWICHMGPSGQLGVEITDKVQVRITGSLAATEKEVPVVVGSNATVSCKTANGNRPLQYCRFLTPTLVGLSVDSSVTQENSILDRYYFTPNLELDFGDCSLTINPVTVEDVGEWTCAALVDDDSEEARDTVILYIEQGTQRPLRAGIIGMGAGVAALVLVLGGVLSYKRYGKNISAIYRRRFTTQTNGTEIPLDRMSNRSSLSSTNSSELGNTRA